MNTLYHYALIIGASILGAQALLLSLLLPITGSRFDTKLKADTHFMPDGKPPTKIQRTIQYALCIFDMNDFGYARRHHRYAQFDFIAHARTIDIILSSLFALILYISAAIIITLLFILMCLYVLRVVSFLWHMGMV